MRTFLAALLLAADLLCPCAHAQQSDAARQFQEIEAAAERGDAKAQFKLGQEYEFRTDGVSRNYADALKWYHKAAQQGFAAAQTYLGLSYFSGGIVKEDYAKAYAWYRKAAEQGYADAQYSLGLYPQLSTYEEAAKWYRKAAEQGHGDAQYLLGLCYHNGMGVERNPVETAKWYHMAAEQGHANAQLLLGGCYYEGEGVAKDYVEAVKWYRMAAENERDDGQYMLGLCYYQGQGVKRDYAEAAKWYHKAAEQGHDNAQYNLGLCYHNGIGVEKNSTEAYAWFSQAGYRNGNAKKARDALGKMLSPQQLAAAKKRSLELEHQRSRSLAETLVFEVEVAKREIANQTRLILISADLARVTKERPLVNSLGMKFVPVAGTKVLFCVWETRVQDYAVFAKEKGRKVEKPGFEQEPTHPAVLVGWKNAMAFCAWLSKKEERAYRLPTDAEWSGAVGLGVERGSTPMERDGKVADYPWGKAWPPLPRAGNYYSSLKVDNFAYTAPVGAFEANAFGLYDLGGNVREWCEDWNNGDRDSLVVRGGSWTLDKEVNLRSSFRSYQHGMNGGIDLGFRCVLVLPGG